MNAKEITAMAKSTKKKAAKKTVGNGLARSFP
jgi:hypothetical protein